MGEENGKRLKAIVIDIVDGKPVGRKFFNILNTEAAITRWLEARQRQFPNATHANFYPKGGGKCIKQVRFSFSTGDRR